jgi:hypothetical protein
VGLEHAEPLDRETWGNEGSKMSENPMSKDELIQFLDAFRANEELGDASISAWIKICDDAGVRGSLRVIQQREASHVRLLEARLRELGATPRFKLPQEHWEQTMKDAASTDKSDAQKVLELYQKYPDPDALCKSIFDLVDRLDADPESQSLLRQIAMDERATLECVVETSKVLNG